MGNTTTKQDEEVIPFGNIYLFDLSETRLLLIIRQFKHDSEMYSLKRKCNRLINQSVTLFKRGPLFLVKLVVIIKPFFADLFHDVAQ